MAGLERLPLELCDRLEMLGVLVRFWLCRLVQIDFLRL